MAHKFELDIATDDQKMLAQIVEYYHRTLKASQEAMAYLTWRGISNNQVIERFRIGYADRTLGLKLPSKKVKAGSDIRNRLEKLGLFRESGHEHFTGSLVFPITACDGTRWLGQYTAEGASQTPGGTRISAGTSRWTRPILRIRTSLQRPGR